MKDIRQIPLSYEQYRKLVLASRKMGKSISRTVEELFADVLKEPKN